MTSLIRQRLNKKTSINPELLMATSEAHIKSMEKLDPNYRAKCKRKCLAYQNAAKQKDNSL